MDLTLIKQRLQANQSKPKQKLEKIDYTKIFWKPKAGKHQIRIVPSKLDRRNPFREVYLHYGIEKFPIFALTNWGEPDPIVDFVKELKKSKEKENWTLASKLSPKMRVFIPVIVRGEEQLGTRLWEVGKTTYMDLLGIADDEDYGDYTDIVNGRDFTVDAIEDVVAGRKCIKCSIRVKPKTSAITEDEVLLERILNEQPDILEINVRYKKTYESLKETLQKWLHPESETDTTADVTATIASEDDEESHDTSDGIYNEAEVGEVKASSKSNKFDSLFKDEE